MKEFKLNNTTKKYNQVLKHLKVTSYFGSKCNTKVARRGN
jgi:hypothetical protein